MRSKRSTYEVTRRFSVVTIIPGTEGAVAVNYGKFYVADRICTVLRIVETHEVLGTDLGAVNLQVERLQGVEASGAGDALLVATIDLKAAINTAQAPALVGGGTEVLAVGDRLNLVDTGVLTDVTGVCVTVDMEEA